MIYRSLRSILPGFRVYCLRFTVILPGVTRPLPLLPQHPPVCRFNGTHYNRTEWLTGDPIASPAGGINQSRVSHWRLRFRPGIHSVAWKSSIKEWMTSHNGLLTRHGGIFISAIAPGYTKTYNSSLFATRRAIVLCYYITQHSLWSSMNNRSPDAIPVLDVENVKISSGHDVLVNECSFCLYGGERVCIIGSSGSGK